MRDHRVLVGEPREGGVVLFLEEEGGVHLRDQLLVDQIDLVVGGDVPGHVLDHAHHARPVGLQVRRQLAGAHQLQGGAKVALTQLIWVIFCLPRLHGALYQYRRTACGWKVRCLPNWRILKAPV